MTDDVTDSEASTREKVQALYQVAVYRPALAFGIILLSIFTAVLEGIGLSFLVPVIEIAQGTSGNDASTIGHVFIASYEFIGVPFTLESVIIGVALVMAARYFASFSVAFLREMLRTDYIRHLQTEGLENALGAQITYYDEHGSDEILNAIVTQSEYASKSILFIVRIIEQAFVSLMYLAIALYLAPGLTILSGVVLGGFLYGLRYVLESGYMVGGRVADANERVQEAVQASTQGIREVKLFGLSEELFEEFESAVNQFTDSMIRLRRNEALIDNIYQLATAITVFFLIYLALTFASLSLASLGVFLFAMFRLAPRVSTLNNFLYKAEGNLPHLIRTQSFVEELRLREETSAAEENPSDRIKQVEFDGVEFTYGDEPVLRDVSFEIERGEFAAFVGPSGAGKSTIVSLLARFYDPTRGKIRANGTPIERFDIAAWRDRITIVRQNPYMFNKSLRFNITLGNRDATEEEIRHVCEIAQVIEFLDDLPDGLNTVLGDDGVRLSGGQKQRVAIARALLKTADLLVFDEATSDLDSELEEQVQTGIESMERDYAMLVIAHRLSTVTNADQIYVMDDGCIVEEGAHPELVNNDGQYASLYGKQS